MRYFTPELIALGQSADDAILNEADAVWEARCEQYEAYLDQVKGRYPPGLRHIESNYYLHDSDVTGIGRAGGQLVFFLRLDWPSLALLSQSLLTFRYDLVEEPHIDREALPEVARFGGVPMWQYDEIELVEGDPPTWRQSILLSNGWEIGLHFRDVQVEEIEAMLPAPRKSSCSAPEDLSRTA